MAYNVVYISRSFQRGGAALGNNNVAKALRDCGNRVICVDENCCFKANKLMMVIRKLERVIEKILMPNHVDGHFIRIWRPTIKLKKIIEEYSPDIIQIGFSAGNIISFNELKNVDVPVVLRMSDLWPFAGYLHYPNASDLNMFNKIKDKVCALLYNVSFKNNVIKLLEKPNLCIVFPSYWLMDKFVGEGHRVTGLRVIRNSFPCIDNGSDSCIVRSSVAKKNVVVVVIATKLDDYRKGVWELRRYLKDDVDGKSIMFVLIGEYSEKIKGFFCDYGGNVSFRGTLNKDDVSDQLSLADFLLCPSLYDNSPNVILEAFSVGVPVIVQSGSGASEYVTDGYDGLIFDFINSIPGDLGRLISSQKSVNIDRHNCYKKLLAEYSPEKIGGDYCELYNYVTGALMSQHR